MRARGFKTIYQQQYEAHKASQRRMRARWMYRGEQSRDRTNLSSNKTMTPMDIAPMASPKTLHEHSNR